MTNQKQTQDAFMAKYLELEPVDAEDRALDKELNDSTIFDGTRETMVDLDMTLKTIILGGGLGYSFRKLLEDNKIEMGEYL